MQIIEGIRRGWLKKFLPKALENYLQTTRIICLFWICFLPLSLIRKNSPYDQKLWGGFFYVNGRNGYINKNRMIGRGRRGGCPDPFMVANAPLPWLFDPLKKYHYIISIVSTSNPLMLPSVAPLTFLINSNP